MATTAAKTLAEAAKWLGYQESPYSEETPFGPMFGWYNDYEWCGIFCQYCIAVTGGSVGTKTSDTIPFTHYTVTGVQAFKALGRFYSTPRDGDLIYIRWGNYGDPVHHVGFVEDASNWPVSVRTIEGNIDEAVGRFVRYNNGTIVGFGRPQYASNVSGTANVLSPQALVYRWLKNQGFSDAGAAGIMGNLQQESTFRFDIVEGMGTDISVIDDVKYSGIGILQWSFSRRIALLAYAVAQGKPWQDGKTQLDFLLKEVNESSRYKTMWADLKRASDPVGAAKIFDDVFVRSGVKGQRFVYAQNFYDRIRAGEFGTIEQKGLGAPEMSVPSFI